MPFSDARSCTVGIVEEEQGVGEASLWVPSPPSVVVYDESGFHSSAACAGPADLSAILFRNTRSPSIGDAEVLEPIHPRVAAGWLATVWVATSRPPISAEASTATSPGVSATSVASVGTASV